MRPQPPQVPLLYQTPKQKNVDNASGSAIASLSSRSAIASLSSRSAIASLSSRSAIASLSSRSAFAFRLRVPPSRSAFAFRLRLPAFALCALFQHRSRFDQPPGEAGVA